MAVPILRPLSFGEVLDGAFTLYRRHFATFALTALLPTLGILIGFLVLGDGFVRAMTNPDPSAAVMELFGGMAIVLAIGFAGTLVMWPALTHQAAQAYTRQPISVADGFRAGARAALPLLGAAILAWIALAVAGFGFMLVVGVVAAIFFAMGSVMAIIGGVLAAFGYVAFIYCAAGLLFGIVPAIVVEGAGPLEALQRSFTLAHGALKRVGGVIAVALLITYLPMMAVMALTGGFAQMMDPSAVPSGGQVIAQQVLGMGVGVLTTPFLVSVIVLQYFDRRVRTEALDVQMMADSLAVAGD